MKIEFKNIKVNLAFSEETTCFNADIFVDGKKTAYARNDGHGGCTHYCSYHKPNDDYNLRQAEAFAKTLPSTTHHFGGKDLVIESSLEGMIDQAIDDYVNAKEKIKFAKKVEKAMENNIVFGIPNGGAVSSLGYGKTPLKAVCLRNLAQVQALVDRIRKEHCKDGVEILNTNLNALGLK